MAIPNVIINLANGSLGRVSASDDGVAGLVLTGAEVSGKFELNKVYTFSSTADLTKYGITAENNPLIYKDVSAFYTEAGDGAELYVLAVPEATTLTQINSNADGSPMRKLITAGGGRICLVGVNRNPGESYQINPSECVDPDLLTGVAASNALAENYAAQMWTYRVLMPAIAWDGTTEGIYKPRSASYNRVGVVLASDGKFGDGKYFSAAIGQVLGRAAKIAVNVSIARVRSGAIAPTGYLTDGSTPQEHSGIWNLLDEAGYIFYRTFVGKSGFYLNDDHTAAPASDDYSSLSNGRVIDKAIKIVYTTYVDYIMDNIAVDEKGQIPVGVCKDFEASIIRAVNLQMANEISSFEAYINPAQNVISSGQMEINCDIVPTAILRHIKVNLGFKNPFQ